MKISVTAHPKARNPRIETDLLGVIHVYVKEPPIDGKANQAIIKALSKHFEVKTSNIIFLSGQKSKNKQFKVIR